MEGEDDTLSPELLEVLERPIQTFESIGRSLASAVLQTARELGGTEGHTMEIPVRAVITLVPPDGRLERPIRGWICWYTNGFKTGCVPLYAG